MKIISNTIKINCETKETLKLDELTEFQGNLKARDDADFNKIIKSIKEYGFSFPFYVWKNNSVNYILDGHGRFGALKRLDNLGYLIPPLPIVYVGQDIEEESKARDLLLRLNSNFGKMTKESVLEFIGDYEIELENFELPCGTINFDEMPDLELEDDSDSEYHRNLGVIVECQSEEEMEQTLLHLKKLGYKCIMVE